MPLYDYRCDSCGEMTEVLQHFDAAPLAECPKCGGSVRKMPSAPALQFKGTGWYVTDYGRSTGRAASGAAEASAATATKPSATAAKPGAGEAKSATEGKPSARETGPANRDRKSPTPANSPAAPAAKSSASSS